MTQHSPEYLISEIKRLLQLFQSLCQENRKFLSEPFTFAALQSLIEYRDFATAELKMIESEIGDAFRTIHPGKEFSGLPDLYHQLENGTSEEKSTFSAFRTALQELVSSNSHVEDLLIKEKVEMSEALKKLHKGSSMLKGYAQPGNTESCFIDKIK